MALRRPKGLRLDQDTTPTKGEPSLAGSETRASSAGDGASSRGGDDDEEQGSSGQSEAGEDEDEDEQEKEKGDSEDSSQEDEDASEAAGDASGREPPQLERFGPGDASVTSQRPGDASVTSHRSGQSGSHYSADEVEEDEGNEYVRQMMEEMAARNKGWQVSSSSGRPSTRRSRKS